MSTKTKKRSSIKLNVDSTYKNSIYYNIENYNKVKQYIIESPLIKNKTELPLVYNNPITSLDNKVESPLLDNKVESLVTEEYKKILKRDSKKRHQISMSVK